jgi:aryl-alcohol dehydrogenase-like predicted oxidoreductase
MIQEHQYRSLGISGITVSPLGIGTNQWEQGKNDEAVSQVVQSLLDAGVNFFDSAEVYKEGKSERLLGACIERERRPMVIATKIAPSPTRLSPRLSRRQFTDALDASLARLGVQTIDLYYIHWPFIFLSIETLMDMMAQAVEAGKVRAVGVSNFNAKQMRRAATRLARYNIPLAANEVHYSLLHRQPEVNGVLDTCQELDVALVAYRPLEAGQLTSNNIPRTSSGSSSSTTRKLKQQEVLQETLHAIADKHEKSVSQVALNWLLHRDKHVIPIPGAISPHHAQEIANTLTWELSDEEFAAIDQASSPYLFNNKRINNTC